METAEQIFSFVCGQSRSFIADGAALPVCQRCLGLYLGAALTALWLLGTGIWRRGLPSWSVFLLNVAVLIAAMLGGLHVIDPGPLWRLAFGLWTGHVATLWLAGAAVHLSSLSRPDVRAELPWRATDKVQGLAFPVALAGLAALFPILLPLGWSFWTATAFLGAGVLAATVLMAALAVVYCASRTWRSPRLSKSS
jgi:hypothetical protein